MFPSRHKISYAVELIKYHLLLRGRYFALCQKKFLGRGVLSCGLFAWRPPRFVFFRKRRFAVFRRDGDVVYRLVLHRVVFRCFFRFLLTLLVFSALFMLLSQNRYTFFIGYLCLIIRGYAFVCAAKLLVESFFLVALIFVILAFLLQQIALIYQLSAISSYYFCNNISLKTDFCVLAVFFLLQCVVFALAECLIIFVFIMPLLSV